MVPPDLVAPEAFQRRLRDALLKVHERRTGQRIHPDDVETAALADDVPVSGHWSLLTEDRVFEDMLMNPTVLAMAKYLCGKSAVLSDMVGLLKQNDERMTHPLHTDQHGTPPPAAAVFAGRQRDLDPIRLQGGEWANSHRTEEPFEVALPRPSRKATFCARTRRSNLSRSRLRPVP